MIIQTAPENSPHLVIKQADHARLSGQFAWAFGNEQFAALQPTDPMVFVAGHHDEGWVPIDERVEQDEGTGLPYHLTKTPLSYLVKTSANSPAFNEQHHPYSGILSSMHTYGLFNGRYGLSDKIFIDLVPAEHKSAVQAMLQAELDRQTRLKAQLQAAPGTAVWVTEDILLHNYKLLQFFDTLALYFHMVHESQRDVAHFPNVPRAVGDDVTITITPVKAGVYALAPYPFREGGMLFDYMGYPMMPQPIGADLKTMMATIDPVIEQITLIGAE